MKFERLIYKRYIFSKKKFQFISLINILSIIGIAIGASSLIIILSIFNGFSKFTINELVSQNPHISIQNPPDELEIKIQKLEDVKTYNYSSISEVLIDKNNSKVNATLIYSDIYENNSLSVDLSNKLNVFTSDTISVISLDQIDMMISSLSFPIPKKITIDNIDYRTKNVIKTNINNLKYQSSKKFLNIFLDDFNKAENLKKQLLDIYHNLNIETWKSKNFLLLLIMEIEKYFVFFVLFIVVVIASFNLFASLSMTIFEKSKDIGILRTLGVNKFQIRSIFISQGFISGLIGLIIGIILGVLIIFSQIEYEWINVNVGNGFSHSLPVELNIWNLIFVFFSTLLIIFLSSYYPAKFSTEKSISDSIKVNF